MPDYSYTATNISGKIIRGIRSAESEADLIALLKHQGLHLLDHRSAKTRQFLELLTETQLGTVSRQNLIDFSYNMGIMIQAGVSVIRALEELREDIDKQALKKVIGQMIQNIQQGDSLHLAMSRHSATFPPLYHKVIEIGENTGRLDSVFFDLAKHLKRINDLVRDIKKALIYPIAVFLAMMLASFVFLILVFPPLLTMLAEFDVHLPLVTRIVMGVSFTLKEIWIVLLPALVFSIVAIMLLRKRPQTRKYFDWLEINLFITRKLFLQLRFAFFMRYMALLLSAGVDILRGLELSIGSIDNTILQEKLRNCKEQVTGGSSLSSALRTIHLVPNMVIRMVAVGEESGMLDKQMERVADYYNEELTRRISISLALMEPILIFFLAGLAMFLAMGVLLPLYDLVSQISVQVGNG